MSTMDAIEERYEAQIAELKAAIAARDADIMKWVRISGENQKSANLSARELSDCLVKNGELAREVVALGKYKAFWDAARLTDKLRFEAEWTTKEADHEPK